MTGILDGKLCDLLTDFEQLATRQSSFAWLLDSGFFAAASALDTGDTMESVGDRYADAGKKANCLVAV